MLVCLTAVEAASDITPDAREFRWPAVVTWARAWSQPFRSTNAYGLFRVMTDQRDEVIIEGSRDGIDWQPYEFKWKPGDPNRRPAFATPHMPRLDWQIWTPFLGGFGQNGWMVNLVDRLLHGEPKVLALLAPQPVPRRPAEIHPHPGVPLPLHDPGGTCPDRRMVATVLQGGIRAGDAAADGRRTAGGGLM